MSILDKIFSPRKSEQVREFKRGHIFSWLLSAFCLGFFSAVEADLIPAVEFTNPSENYQNEYPWTLGFEFRLWEDISIQALGFYDAGADGFAEDHQVGLWNAEGELLASAIVSNASALRGLFRWETIAPVNLFANGRYVIAGFDVLDDYTWNPDDFQQDSRFYFRGARYQYGESLAFPEDSLPELIGIFGPNFLIADPLVAEPPHQVPLPSSIVLLVAGLMLLVSKRSIIRMGNALPALAGLVLVMLSPTVHALSATAQPVQGPLSWDGQMPLGERYERYRYEYVGAIAEYDNVFDAQGNYIVPVGEKFRWVWLRDNIQLGAYEWTYLGGSNRCWIASTGTQSCGTFNRFLALNQFRCKPETGSYTLLVFRNGVEIDQHGFSAERFKIKTDPNLWQYPPQFRPKHFAGKPETDGDGEKKPLSFKVVDDLSCRQPLRDVRVTIQSFVVPASNHHAHFSAGDKGTGKFVKVAGHEVTLSDTDTKAEGRTNVSGELKLEYRAMDFAVDEVVKLKFVRPAENGYPENKLEGSFQWAIKMGDFVQEDPYPHGWLFGNNPTKSCMRPHTEQAKYLRADVWPALMRGLNNFYYLTNEKVLLNDASFPNGGAVDTVTTDCNNHGSHRQGNDIDINSNLVGFRKNLLTDTWQYPFEFPPEFRVPAGEKLVDLLTKKLEDSGFERVLEDPIHYRY